MIKKSKSKKSDENDSHPMSRVVKNKMVARASLKIHQKNKKNIKKNTK